MIRSSLFILFLYFYIFNPPIIEKHYSLAIWFAVFFVALVSNPRAFLSYLKAFHVELIFVLFLILYSLTIDLYHGEIVYSDRLAYWWFQCLIFPFVVFLVYERLYTVCVVSGNDLMHRVYYVVVIGGILTCLLIFFPSFDYLYSTIQYDVYYELYSSFERRYRAYGIAENLNFTYGYILGCFAAYAFFKVRDGFLNILSMLLLLVGAAYNARIGFIGFGFMLLLLPIYGVVTKHLLAMVLLVIISIYSLYNHQDMLLYYFSWVYGMFEEILTGQSNSSDSLSVFKTMLVFPTNIENFLFGSGETLVGQAEGYSDIGYIIQLYYGGVFFLFLLLLFMLYCVVRLSIYIGWQSWYLYLFIFSTFFLNTKGFLFAGTPGARFLYLMYIVYILSVIYSRNDFRRHCGV